MLKSVLYSLLFLTTSVRLFDIVYLLFQEGTNLPIIVFIAASAVVIYGMVLLTKKFISVIRLKELMYFFIIQSIVIAFNLAYVALATPLAISVAEALVVGTFLDLIINSGIIFACVRQMRVSHLDTFTSIQGNSMNV